MVKSMDRAVWETLDGVSKKLESLIEFIQNEVGPSEHQTAALQKLNDAYKDIIKACEKDQERRDLERARS